MMSDWLYQTLAQQYEENLCQIRQYLIRNMVEQRRLATIQQQIQQQLRRQEQQELQFLALKKQQNSFSYDVVPMPIAAMDCVTNADLDSVFAAKAKEQKMCQEIYDRFLQQLNRNGPDYDSLLAFTDKNAMFSGMFDDPIQKNMLSQVNGAIYESANFFINNNLSGVAFSQPGIIDSTSTPLFSNSIPNLSSLSSSNAMEKTTIPSPSANKTTGELPSSPSTSSSCDVSGEFDEIDEQRPYRCTICDKKFRFKSNLFEHKSLHVKSQAFHCPFCGKTCRLKGNLKKHLQVHVNTVEDLEKLWKKRFSRSSGRPRKDTPPKPLPAVGDDLGLVPINKSKPFFATWVFSDDLPSN